MPLDINWGLAQPVDIGGMFQAGLERGTAQRKEREQQSALTAYVQKPNEQTLSALAPYQPGLVLSERSRLVKEQQDQQARAALVQAYGGAGGPAMPQNSEQAPGGPPMVPGAQEPSHPPHPTMGALIAAGVPVEMARQVQDDHIKEIGRLSDFLGQVGLNISSLPDDQRPAAWQQAVQQAHSFGIEVPPEFAQYSPQALSGVLAASKQVKEAIGITSPDYRAVPAGGYLENVNPHSRTTPIPSGPQSAAPQPGTVEDGFRFKGGDPADPNNWEAAGNGGAGPSGPQTFR